MPDGLLNYVRCPHCGGNAGAPTHQCDEEARAAAFEASPFGQALHRPPWSPHHSSPESDPQALRYELDGCRAEIERLRAERAADPLAAILRAVWPDVEAQRWSDTYNGRDPLRSMVADGVLTLEQAGIVEVLLAAPSPVLGESGEGT